VCLTVSKRGVTARVHDPQTFHKCEVEDIEERRSRRGAADPILKRVVRRVLVELNTREEGKASRAKKTTTKVEYFILLL